MATTSSWQLPLPDPTPLDPAAATAAADEVEAILLATRDQVNARYETHGIEALLTKTTRQEPSATEAVVYALYLSFSHSNHFSYRLFELTSHTPNGGLPVSIQPFSGIPTPPSEARTPEELRLKIDDVFLLPRTKMLINTYYQP